MFGHTRTLSRLTLRVEPLAGLLHPHIQSRQGCYNRIRSKIHVNAWCTNEPDECLRDDYAFSIVHASIQMSYAGEVSGYILAPSSCPLAPWDAIP